MKNIASYSLFFLVISLDNHLYIWEPSPQDSGGQNITVQSELILRLSGGSFMGAGLR